MALRRQSSGVDVGWLWLTPQKNVADRVFPGQNVLRVSAEMRGFRLLLVTSLMVMGCGRKATREDCEMIVDRNIEVKLRADGVTDPAVIQKRKDEIRPTLKEDIDKCVGKRVTDSMMTCVKTAETAEQIDKCLR